MGRLGRTSLYAVLAVLALAVSVLPSIRSAATVAPAEARVEKVAEAAIAVYAALRVVNAAISFVQETEIGASIGVSGSVHPLSWLDPVDDTVERVAGLVFWVVLAAGVVGVAMDPLSAIGWGLLALYFALRCSMEIMPTPAGHDDGSTALLRRGRQGLFGLGAGLAALPLVLVAGLALGELVTADTYDEAKETLDRAEAQAEPVIRPFSTPPEADDDEGWLEWARGSWEATLEAARAFASTTHAFYDNATDLLKALVTILSVLLFRLVVLPAFLLWAVLAVLRRAF